MCGGVQMKIRSFVTLSLVLLQLNFSVFAQEDDYKPTKSSDKGGEALILGMGWSIPIGVLFAHLINTKTTPRKEKESDGFFAGNFGISRSLEGSQVFLQNNSIASVTNSFFSASIGHFSVGHPSRPHRGHGNYELQIDFEYLQDTNILSSEKVNLLKAFLSNLTGYTSEDNAFYLGFGMGGGKLDIRSLLNGDTQFSDTGYILQFRAGKIFQLPAEEFRVNLGYRGILFAGGIDNIFSNRFEAGLEYKWK